MPDVSGHVLNAEQPAGRASIVVNPRDYWDETNQRPKSGYFNITVTALTWTGTGTGSYGSERVDITIGHPIANTAHNTLHEHNVAFSAAGIGSVTHVFNTAWNYGVPGPSARVNADGTVALIDAEISLEEGVDTEVTTLAPALGYTLNFIEYNPHIDLSTAFNMGSEMNMPLSVNEDKRTAEGVVKAPVVSDTKACVLQFSSLTVSSYKDNILRDESSVSLQITTAPSGGTFPSVMAMHGVSNAATSSLPYRDGYTLVIAKNDNKYDANATVYSINEDTCVAVAGVTMRQSGGDDSCTATLNYYIAEDPTAL